MNETISVVVPTYNSAPSLPKAIESIRIQRWPDLEIIVVDDGSHDDTPAVLKELAADDLHVITQSNRGPGAARNRGIEIARGKWVAFLDADDVWLPGKLHAQMDCLQRDDSLGFCYANSVRRATNGAERIHRPSREVGNIFVDLLLGPQFDLPTIVMRRDCFDEIGLFDPGLRTGEDWDLWLRLSAFYRGCHVPTALALCSISDDPGKYPLDMFEQCQIRILSKLFSNPHIARLWPQLAKYRSRIYSWHYAVLAKSRLYRKQPWGFLRLGAASVFSHPMGLYFLARKWNNAERWPNLDGLRSEEISA
jgi:glycosyltransferase involved in cell wall biosynthesis